MLLTIYDTEWPTLCWCAVNKLLTHSLRHEIDCAMSGGFKVVATHYFMAFCLCFNFYCSRKRQQCYFQHRHLKFVSLCETWTTTQEPLHSAWWNSARSCTLTNYRSLLNIKVIDQSSRSHRLLCVSCVHDAAWTSWPGNKRSIIR